MSEIDQSLRAQVEQLEYLYSQGHLSEANFRAALVGLGLNPGLTLAQPMKSDERQVAIVTSQAAAEEAIRTTYHVHIEKAYGLAIGDRSQSSVAPSDEHTAPDDASALAQYLHYLIEVNRRLQLQGIRSAGHLVSIDLEDLYITLTATDRRTVTGEEAAANHLRGAVPDIVAGVQPVGQTHLHEVAIQAKVKVQEALAVHPRLVVLGDPGSGKTTLVRYLALTYARDLCGEKGLVAQRLELLEQRLPILLPLRDFASYLQINCPDSSTDGPRLLLDYLRTYFAHQAVALPDHFFADWLNGAKCVVLFDGLDEVADLTGRRRVARIVERFTIAYPDNRYVITSRIVGYTGGARLGEDYFVTTIHDFSQADIERFVTYWNHAVEVALAGGETPHALAQARHQTEALLQSIKGNERIRDLAVNPLMLTVIALVQRYRARLPERRTELYEEAVEVLLGKWDQAKGLELDEVMPSRQLDAGDRRGLLEPIALWMMEKRVREIEVEELHRQVEERFSSIVSDQRQASKATADFLQLVNERSGLLTERGQGIYAFSHLTFQEHLAARAIADHADYIPYTLARLGDSWWREVILLEAGYLSTQGKHRVTALIKAIMDHSKEPERYHNLLLAADALRDVGLARVDGELWAEVRTRVRRDVDRGPAIPLIKKWEQLKLSLLLRQKAFGGWFPNQVYKLTTRLVQLGSPRRNAAAMALARMGDAYWSRPYGEPEWIDIPVGEFWMGSEDGYTHEQPPHRVYLDFFRMARVPITNAQYRFFVESTGHRAPTHWEDNRPSRGLEIYPVVNVSWNDALAYCHWLSEMTGKRITLPSEAQWEKAARGHLDRRRYPWGDEWDQTRCNTRELGIGGPTPVGIFPEGSSPYGCLDMSGNVSEWTLNLWGADSMESMFRYPYDPADGRENLSANYTLRRVTRGGNYECHPYHVRCSNRYRPESSDGGSPLIGFRVIVSSIG